MCRLDASGFDKLCVDEMTVLLTKCVNKVAVLFTNCMDKVTVVLTT